MLLGGALSDAPLGATVTVDLAADTAQHGLAMEIPSGALFDPGTGTGVWTIQGTPARAAWHRVHVESLSDDTASVTGDLREGVRVVALGSQVIHEGENVRVAQDGTTTASVTPEGARQ